MKVLAIDIGGTNIKYALWSDGELGTVEEIPTPHDSLDSLVQIIQTIANKFNDFSGIAVSMPGFVDSRTGIAHTGGALTYIKEFEAEKVFSEATGYPVTVENDAKSATLAEMKEGSLKGIDNAIIIILGTGVGGSIVVNGKILSGNNLLAGEFSFLNADINNPNSETSSIAYLCGAKGLSDCIKEETGIPGLNGREIFERIHNGDERALKGLRKFCSRIAWLLYNLELITNPQIFAIGGGISQQPLLIKTIQEEIDNQKNLSYRSFLVPPKVVACKFRSRANLIGAVHNFLLKKS